MAIAVYGGEATTPTVTAVALTSDPGTDATYAIEDVVEATVTFSEAVDITGAPQLELDFDGTPKPANCAAATNTTTMVCSYTVAENDLAPNGIAIAANKLTFNGGAITLNGTARTAVLTHSTVAIDSGHKVDGVRPTLVTTGNDAPQTSADGTQVIFAVSEDIGSISNGNLDLKKGILFLGAGATATFSGRTVTVTLIPIFTIQYDETVTLGIIPGGVRDTAGNSMVRISDQAVTNKVPQPPAVISMVEITSDPGMDSNYATGDDIEVTATFDQAVAVTGKPRIEVRLGTGSPTGRWAEYASGSGTTALVFSYTVLATDESDTDGIEVGDTATFSADNVDLNGGTITVVATGEDASLAYTPVVSNSVHRVNWARPTLSSAVTSTDGTKVILTFSENLAPGGRDITFFTVTVGGTAVTLSGTVATVSGNSVTLTLATALTSATQAVTVSYADPTAGDDSTGVQDLADNDADSFTDQMVTNAFGSATTVTGVEITSSSVDGTNGIGDAIEATVTFSAAVDITGSPQLELDFDGTPKPANCVAATNTTTMACRYTVAVNDSAPNGIAIAANKLTLNGGTIRATGSTTIDANLDHGAVAIDANHKVDGIRPTLVTTGADAPTTSADGTKVILTFSETIGGVSQSDITIQADSVTAATSVASVAGTTVELTLTTALTATATNLTVALAAAAVEDNAENGNLAVAATPVINAITNNAPEFTEGTSTTRSVAENTASGQNIGAAVTATDTDTTDTLTYTLGGTDAADFGIVSANGQLQTSTALNYETKDSYEVTVSVSDGNAGEDSINVTINVTADRGALVALYDATGGANWTYNTNWLTSKALSEWYGVETDEDGRVRELNLNGNKLSGEIPAQLGRLTNLEYLYLALNKLSGTIPAELGRLANLQKLYLSKNELSGEIPVELGDLTTLQSLYLDENELMTGTIPTALANLAQLQEFDFSNTGLCAPSDAAFQAWLAKIDSKGAVCAVVTPTPNGGRGDSAPSNQTEATPELFTLDFAHFANGEGITSDLVFVNVATQPTRLGLDFYDKEGNPIAAETVVNVTEDLEITEDGALSVRTAMEPLGELTISTHGQGELVSGSVTVSANGPIGGVLALIFRRSEWPGWGPANP